MKNLLAITFSLLFLIQGYSQSGIHYQAVIRDAGGSILSNVPVEVDVTIRPSSGSSYFETIDTETNDFGILNITIGDNGNFDLQDLNWEFGDVAMDLEITSGTNSILIEDQPLQNVPYAYFSNYAQKAIDDEVDDADADPSNELQSIQFDNTSRELTLSDGNTVIIPDEVNDADADPTNEVQSIVFDPNTRELAISDANSVSIPDQVDDADADPQNEIQILSYDSLSQSISISNSNQVSMAPFISKWHNSPNGIYTDTTAHIGSPGSTNSLQLDRLMVSFNGPSTDPQSYWTNEELFLQGSDTIFNTTISNASIELNGIGGGFPTAFPYTHKIDTSGFISSNEIWDLRSVQGPGFFRAINTPLSDQIFSDLSSNGLTVRDGGQITSITTNELEMGIEGDTRVNVSADGFGAFQFYNGGNNLAAALSTETGPGILTLNSGTLLDLDAILQPGELRFNNDEQNMLLEDGSLSFGNSALQMEYVNLFGVGYGSLSLNNGANWEAVTMSGANGPGYIIAHSGNGQKNVEIRPGFTSNTNGLIRLYKNGLSRITSTITSSGAGSALYQGDNNTNNVLVTNPANRPDHGYVLVYDGNDQMQAGMLVNGSGDGQLFADVKNFRMPHPEQRGKSILYACVEGPEVAAYDRGTAKLVDGQVKITFSDHFKIVANPETMTVMLTPHSADTYGLAVVEKTNDGFVVKEFKGGKGNFSFDWEVKCKRRGYEDWKVIQNDADMRPELPQEVLTSPY